MFGLQERVPKVVVAIYLEAEDFEAMKKVGAARGTTMSTTMVAVQLTEMLSRFIKSW